MELVVGLHCAALAAIGVFFLLSQERDRRIASGDALLVATAPDPFVWASLVFFLTPATPLVLWRHRGGRGLAEGVALCGLALAMAMLRPFACWLLGHEH